MWIILALENWKMSKYSCNPLISKSKQCKHHHLPTIPYLCVLLLLRVQVLKVLFFPLLLTWPWILCIFCRYTKYMIHTYILCREGGNLRTKSLFLQPFLPFKQSLDGIINFTMSYSKTQPPDFPPKGSGHVVSNFLLSVGILAQYKTFHVSFKQYL